MHQKTAHRRSTWPRRLVSLPNRRAKSHHDRPVFVRGEHRWVPAEQQTQTHVAYSLTGVCCPEGFLLSHSGSGTMDRDPSGSSSCPSPESSPTCQSKAGKTRQRKVKQNETKRNETKHSNGTSNSSGTAMRCDAMRCDAMPSEAKRCEAMRCRATQSDAEQGKARHCNAVQCNVSKEEQSQAILENNTAKFLTSKVPLIFFRVALE